MVVKPTPQAEGNSSHDKDRECQQCHRHKEHAPPHHADAGRVWEYWPWLHTRARHYIDCPSRRGKCVEFHDEDGERHQCHRRVGHRGPHHAVSGLVWGGRRRGMRTRKRDYTDCPGRGGFTGVVTLFLPMTWPPRFVFLAVILFSASIPIPGPFNWILIGSGIFFLVAAVGLICFGIRVERSGDLFALLATILNTIETGIDDDVNPVARLMGIAVIVIALAAGMASLAFLATNGRDWKAAYYYQSHGALGWAEDVLLLAVFWLVFGIPYQASMIKLVNGGYVQRFLVSVITGAASVLSAAYLLLASLAGGPLRNVKTNELVVGILFTAVVVAPFYRFLARSFFVDPAALSRAWHSVEKEARVALDQPVRAKGTPCNEEPPEADKTHQEAAAPAVIPARPALSPPPRRERDP